MVREASSEEVTFEVRLKGGAGRKQLKSQETSFRQREEKHRILCQSASPESDHEEASDKIEGLRENLRNVIVMKCKASLRSCFR